MELVVRYARADRGQVELADFREEYARLGATSECQLVWLSKRLLERLEIEIRSIAPC